jgi:cytoskeleton-associated protein 5
MPPKDILPELKKEFWEGLESKKWSERKGALTALKELASYPKVQPGDFGDVNREIKKIIAKDSNVQVVAEAILCTGTLAKGLRASYAGTARSLCPVLLDKFKEKNSAVQKAVWEALGRMHKFCFTLQDVVEDVTGAPRQPHHMHAGLPPPAHQFWHYSACVVHMWRYAQEPARSSPCPPTFQRQGCAP